MKIVGRTEKYCPDCKQTKPISEFYNNRSRGDGVSVYCKICQKRRVSNRTKNGNIYHNSKSCSQYFGVCIAEKLLEKTFKNANRSRFGTKGYDFICGKGFKVDSKSAALRNKNRNSKKPRMGWEFGINYNKIADYFACFAFDNRTSLTPLHFWLIPGKDVNHLKQISITISTLPKWKKYEQPIEKIELACSTMKGEHDGN